MNRPGLTLGEFYENLMAYIEREQQRYPHHPDDWRKLKLEVPLANPSVGPHAGVEVVGMGAGFDWDRGTFFIQTAERVMVARDIKYPELEKRIKEITEIYTKDDRQWLPKQRKHCFETGLKEGARMGMFMRHLPDAEFYSKEQPMPIETPDDI